MNLNIFFLILLSSILAKNISGQETITFTLEDSTKISILDREPINGKRSAFYFGLFYSDYSTDVVGFNYYNKRLFVNTRIGLSPVGVGGTVEGNFFPFSKSKDAKYKQTIRSTSEGMLSNRRITRIQVKLPGKKIVNYGLHAGVNYYSLGFGIIGGLSRMVLKYIKINSEFGGAKQGTAYIRINADIVYWPTNKTVYEDFNQLKKIGYQLSVDGKATFWSEKSNWGIHYLLGYSLNSKFGSSQKPFIFGLGLGRSF